MEDKFQIYSEEILDNCRKGKPCSYGICDECPNILRDIRSNEDNDEE